MIDYSKYIGIPYKNGGRNFNGVDCYGLLHLFFKNELNIVLPDYSDLEYSCDWYKSGKNHILDNIGTEWVKAEKPYRMFDGLIFFLGTKKIANHIGLFIGRNRILHIYESINSQIDLLDRWENKLYGIIRYYKFM